MNEKQRGSKLETFAHGSGTFIRNELYICMPITNENRNQREKKNLMATNEVTKTVYEI